MPHKSVVSKLGLALLALVTVVVTAFAVIYTRAMPAGETTGRPPSGSSTVTSGQTPQASPTARPSTPAASTEPTGPKSASEIRQLLARNEATTVLVLSDESGAGADSWVRQWAEMLAEQRQVSYQQWSDGNRFVQPTRLGTSNSGPAITIRNASFENASADSLAEAAASLLGVKPDIVIMSLGINEQPDDLKADMTKLYDAVVQDAAGIVILQNFHRQDADKQRLVISQMKSWATEQSLPIINIQGVFEHDSAPLVELLDDGGKVPNQRGANLWAFGVSQILGP